MNERDAKGRFTKGNTEGKKFTVGTAAAVGKAGAAASTRAKRERKTLAQTLREELDKMASAGGAMTKQEYIVAKCLDNLAKGKCTPQDLKTMSEVLGELKQNINLDGDGMHIIVRDSAEASKIDKLINR